MVGMIGGLPGNVAPEDEEQDGFGVELTDPQAALRQARILTNKAYDAKAQMLREARSGQTGMERLRGALLAAAAPGRNKSNWDTLRQGLTAWNESGVAARDAEEKQRLGLMGLESERNLSLAELEAKYGTKGGGNRKVGVNPVTGEYFLTNLEEGAGNVTTLGRPQAPAGDSGVQIKTVTDPTTGRKVQVLVQPGPYGRPTGEVLKPEPKTSEELAQAAADLVTAKEDAKVRADARRTLPVALRTADAALKGVDELLKHPGLSAVVGIPNPFQGGLGPLGEMRGTPAAGFKTRLDQLTNGAFLEAYNLLKGGGAITNIEGEKAEKAMIRASTAQSEEEFIAAMNDFRNAIISGIRLLREQAGGVSDASRFESPAAAPAAAAPAKPQGAPRPIPANLLEQYRKVPAGNRPEARKRFEAAGYDVSGLR